MEDPGKDRNPIRASDQDGSKLIDRIQSVSQSESPIVGHIPN